jgi:hypothetical protein
MAFQTICLALPIGFSIFKDVMTFLYSFELSFYIELGLKIESVSSSNGIILFLPTCICILEHYVIGRYIARRARFSVDVIVLKTLHIDSFFGENYASNS